MELSEKFKTRAKSLYDSLRGRSKEKRDKNNRITRRGYDLPFTAEQFRTWLIEQFGGENGCTRCRYCTKPIDVYGCQVDHEIPLGREGKPGLANLRPICEPCNQTKGTLTPAEFEDLIKYLQSMELRFGKAPVISITKRLETATKLAAQVRFAMVRGQRKQTEAVVQAAGEDNF